MTRDKRSLVIAIEEHYLDPEVAKLSAGGPPAIQEKLSDLTDTRIKEMDKAGIDIQVLSHCPPGAQVFEPKEAEEKAIEINNRLSKTIEGNPERFAGFATLPTQNPEASERELTRCVNNLNFKGAMLHGLTNGKFHDEEEFWPIFSQAASLDVPIYLHPGFPHQEVIHLYYGKYKEKYPNENKVPRPANWSGWRLRPEEIEFWLDGKNRIHERLKYIRNKNYWEKFLLSP